jgi:long-subunit fatty acid transport protein
MKNILPISIQKSFFILLFFVFSNFTFSQVTTPNSPNTKSDFWQDVQFGGGFGLGIGNGYTNITIAPSAIYNFNQYFSAGLGLQYSYLKQKSVYSSNVFGGSIIGLINPIEEIQLSVELEEMNVNNTYQYSGGNLKDSFWNTALFLGAGYRMDNVTIGARYNVLFDKNKDVYGDAFMPFVRIYF